MAKSGLSDPLADRLDRRVTQWMACHGIYLLRMSLGIVFLWFGLLKFVPSLSPAEPLAKKTFDLLTFGAIPDQLLMPIVATWECLIGLGLISGILRRTVLLLMYLQLAGATAPLILFPGDTFTHFPWAPTLAGQYIIKDLILVSAGLVVGATVRGGKLVAMERDEDPEASLGRRS